MKSQTYWAIVSKEAKRAKVIFDTREAARDYFNEYGFHRDDFTVQKVKAYFVK
jgi:hypothetical protein